MTKQHKIILSVAVIWVVTAFFLIQPWYSDAGYGGRFLKYEGWDTWGLWGLLPSMVAAAWVFVTAPGRRG